MATLVMGYRKEIVASALPNWPISVKTVKKADLEIVIKKTSSIQTKMRPIYVRMKEFS